MGVLKIFLNCGKELGCDIIGHRGMFIGEGAPMEIVKQIVEQLNATPVEHVR